MRELWESYGRSAVSFFYFILFSLGFWIIYGAVSLWEPVLFDFFSEFRNRTFAPTDEVVIVKTDEFSLEKSPWRFPWPRRVYLQFLKTIAADKPRGIYFDVQFTGRSENSEEDAALGAFLAKENCTILVQYHAGKLTLPMEDLNQPGVKLALSHAQPDRDNKIRKLRLYKKIGTSYIPSLPLAAYLDFHGFDRKSIRFTPDGRLVFPDGREIWTDPWSSDEISVNFHRSRKGHEVSILNVGTGAVPPGFFTNKVVLLGATASVLHDVFNTPEGILPGVVIQGYLLADLLGGTSLRRWRATIFGGILLLSLLLGFRLLFHLPPVAMNWVLLFGGILNISNILFFLYSGGGGEFTPFIALLILFAIGVGVKKLLLNHLEKERGEREMEIAREIQNMMFPMGNLETPHGSIGWMNRNADQVGGDYLDYFILESGEVIFVIGDVSGHGVASALPMAFVKSACLLTLRDTKIPLVEFFQRINGLFLEILKRKKMMSMFVGIFNPQKGILRFVNAGHNFPLIAREGMAEFLKVPPSYPLGTQKKSRFNEAEQLLCAGDSLCFYTDGIVEAKNGKGEIFGYDGLKKSLLHHQRLTATEAVKLIFGDLRAFLGVVPPDDDCSLILFKFHGSPPPIREPGASDGQTPGK